MMRLRCQGIPALIDRVISLPRRGTRIVSHAFSMGEWEPEVTEEVNGSTIYMWTVPPRD